MDGILIINKPKNFTSHDIVNIVKKEFNERVGHTGTLDPNATGVLPLLIGKGTLLSKYLIDHDKIYEACLKLGEKRDTADSEGKVIEKREIDNSKLNIENINELFSKMIGKQEQIPPIYSAIKVNGKKLYEYARTGKNVDIKPRNIEIYSLKLIKFDFDEIIFQVHCSKGTYIRTLCENIAENLGNIGYMKELNRLKVGKFEIENSLQLEDIENKDIVSNNFISVEKYFENFEKIEIDKRKLELFLNGVKLTYKNYSDGIYSIYFENKFIGSGTISGELLKRDIII